MPKKQVQPHAAPIKRPRCPRCGGGHVQTRKSDQKRWCRRCGHEGPISEFPLKAA